jgi:hydrogenase-4 component J
LATALAPLRDNQPEPFNLWSGQLIDLLAEIAREPAIYLIVRRVL